MIGGRPAQGALLESSLTLNACTSGLRLDARQAAGRQKMPFAGPLLGAQKGGRVLVVARAHALTIQARSPTFQARNLTFRARRRTIRARRPTGRREM